VIARGSTSAAHVAELATRLVQHIAERHWHEFPLREQALLLGRGQHSQHMEVLPIDAVTPSAFR
jgi:hypothetical protein